MRAQAPSLKNSLTPYAIIWLALVAVAVVLMTTGCGAPLGTERALELGAVESGSAEEAAVLNLVNDSETTLELLDDDVKLDARAARGLINGRPFATIGEVDAVPYVGGSALAKLAEYAMANGYASGAPAEENNVERAILELVNDQSVTVEILDDDVALDARAARNIIAGRPFADIESLDDVPYVGASALQKLAAYALANGYGARQLQFDVVFSPQLYADSHNARVKAVIDAATTSLDIAMYSFRDNGIVDAVGMAIQRGVDVRVVFESANKDRKLTGTALANSTSGKLEAHGANVRYVNKIMHHKMVIADGPKHLIDMAQDAVIATGSANWSHSAATRYDENTLFFTEQPALTLELQREFDHMWTHSRDFIFDATLPFELGTAEITDELVESLRVQGEIAEAHFTSDNFQIRGENTFSILRGSNAVSDQLVAAIESATDSIFVASGHLRSRPISEAIMAAKLANPELDVRVYLDGQEYISASYHGVQERELEDCLEEAVGSVAQTQNCTDRGFYFGYVLGAEHDVDVRYKHYAYRWHYSYAVQMHHKYLIIDGDELWTGSYNLSDNAEHNTLEQILHLEGAAFAGLIAAYTENFLTLWETERDTSAFDDLLTKVNGDSVIPLVYPSMSLTHTEVSTLKNAIRANCDEINSEAFRKSPEKNRVCFR